MSFLSRLTGRSHFRKRPARATLTPLYHAIVAAARAPQWYRAAGVPDTLDGRFDMVATVLAIVLLRLEREGDAARTESALLAELFVEDMDGQLRQSGIGDLVVGRHIGQMMGALGGRIAAFRAALAPGGNLPGAVVRNLHRGVDAGPGATAEAVSRIRTLADGLHAAELDGLLAGRLAT